ncbi:MAG: hypothetical protein Tsb002_15930 [Wenzhouxiangellaceae bacterium]
MQELTPSYAQENIHLSHGIQANSNWTLQASEALLPDFAIDLLAADRSAATRLTFSREKRGSSLIELQRPVRNQDTGLLRERSLRRDYFAPGVVQQLNEDTALSVALVLATQQYGAANLGYTTTGLLDRDRYLQGSQYTPYQEFTNGTGLRFGLEAKLLPWLALTGDYQSRIDMEGFSSFRGVYADPADLDIPERMSVGVNFLLGDRFELIAETERVAYSDVNAFPSTLLPSRFLSLLGDSTSPEFAWSDLTVYRFGWNWQLTDNLAMNFAYATRSQPLPTSDVLADALRQDLARNSFSLGINSRLGNYGDLVLNAAYAPAEYAFGGNVLGIVTSDLDKSVEVEMLWRLYY